MRIVYESKTGFTKKYAEMLAAMLGLKALSTEMLYEIGKGEEVIFLGWMKVGKIQGLHKVRKYALRAVLASGTGRTAEPDTETVVSKNNLDGIPFFYLRGGCLPLHALKGMDKFMLSTFVRTLKKREGKDEKTAEAISIIENGFDGVKEENLLPFLSWLNET